MNISKYTRRIEVFFQLAEQEAHNLKHDFIGSEHLLLALAKDGIGIAAHILKNLDVNLQKIIIEINKLVLEGTNLATDEKLGFTPGANKVLELAEEEAK